MASIACLLLAILLVSLRISATNSDAAAVQLQLKQVQAAINNGTQPFCYHGHSGSRQAFLSHAFDAHTMGLNVLVYPFCVTTHELGNKLGNLFHEVACAEASGLHFVAVHPRWELVGSFQRSNASQEEIHRAQRPQLAFLRALPDVIAHPHALERHVAAANLQQLCKCTRYCWQHKAPWVNHTATAKTYVRAAVRAYLRELGDARTEIDAGHDLTNADEQARKNLPLIPDATIHYRCGDNIGFSFMYGILPFTVFESRVPQNASFIYVLSDHPSRASTSPYTHRCKLILEKLFEFLVAKFPRATVLVKRGGDIFLDYARLALSRTVICSASSYCFWAALSNEGEAHFPLTYLIAGADSIDLATDFGPHFHWIEDAQVISTFKGLRPWTKIIDVLEGKAKLPN